MEISLTQAELRKAVEYWFNNTQLQEDCTVESVKQQGSSFAGGDVLHVVIKAEVKTEDLT